MLTPLALSLHWAGRQRRGSDGRSEGGRNKLLDLIHSCIRTEDHCWEWSMPLWGPVSGKMITHPPSLPRRGARPHSYDSIARPQPSNTPQHPVPHCLGDDSILRFPRETAVLSQEQTLSAPTQPPQPSSLPTAPPASPSSFLPQEKNHPAPTRDHHAPGLWVWPLSPPQGLFSSNYPPSSE